jgi:triacylglycerol lipase
VYRVWHPSDPVPMIPVFPFQHLPHNTKGLSINNGFSGLINADAHSMAESYIPAVDGLNWQHLASTANANEEAEVKSWLEQAAQNQNGFIKGSAKLLTMIQRALMWILKKAGQLLVGTVGTVFTVGVTVLDQLAWMLSQAAQFSIELAGFVSVLVQAIFKFLGKTISTTVSITTIFLRWVLDLLFSNISAIAVNAIASIR